MKPVHIYRHDEWIGAGYFVDTLKHHNFCYELIAIDQGDPVLDEFRDACGLVFLGSDASVSDQHPWIEDELELIRRAVKQKFPIFGHCFGAQLISKALGGRVAPMQAKEIGWHPIEFLDNTIAHTWFKDLPQIINALHWHEDFLTVPEGMSPLFGTRYCPNQAFAADNLIATTAHVEVTSELLQQWLTIYGDHLPPISSTVQSVEEVGKDLELRLSKMQQLADVLYDRWFDMVKNYHRE